MLRSKMLINGGPLDSSEVAVIRNPATGDPVAEVSLGTREDARRALEAAQKAFPGWSSTSPAARGDLLHKGAALVRERSEEIARLLTLEMGKPLKEAKREVLHAAEVIDYYAEEGKRSFGEWLPSSGKSRGIVVRQPVGVAALITPWNYPVDLLSWKVAAALAAGCTAVAKPASLAPLAATALVWSVNDAGLPAGTVNVLHGPGESVGAELVENPISRKIAFTGETATGRWIMASAAAQIKRVSLELGGQSPMIVMDDADLEKAVDAGVQRAFSNMGQLCISVNRIYVQKGVLDEFTARFVERALRLKVGDGMDPGVDLGPMASEAQRRKTKEHIADAVAKGAKVLCGGREPEGEEYRRGFFFLPTVLGSANHSMRVMREETFGPVAPVMGFDSLEEALTLANDTEYGLAAYVFTGDLSKAIRAAEGIEVGMVGVNTTGIMDLHAPFGGWKGSGFGRELGHFGLEGYQEIKHIRIGL